MTNTGAFLLLAHCALLGGKTLTAASTVKLRRHTSAVKNAAGQASFEDFVDTFGRTYARGSEEYQARAAAFQKRMEVIKRHNSRPNRLWTAGPSHLMDRTDEELNRMLGWRRSAPEGGGEEGGWSLLEESSWTQAPLLETVDWRNLSTAYDTADQGECGSCWAVAAAGMMQSRFEIQKGSKATFSVQELVDCVPNPKACGGTGGCEGATVELAMQYVQKHGLRDADSVPYLATASASPVCTKVSLASMHGKQRANRRAVHRWNKLPENRAMPLMRAVADGPVAASVAASDWFFYSSGIFDGCGKDAVIDHAVTLFGYGQDKGKKYWLVRNSWGSSWGEQGFIRLLRHKSPKEDDQFCGTDSDPKAGVACKPYPDSVRVCGMCGILYDSVAARF
eukprot:TRINITY_DN14916_c0_g2_i1.p2 TRINITY_DN14916_c0_g2~~TRINITY_DN14916_c0_g2_i1.p2  ORF type:complete len:393 (+),score=79.39 TRINITY_DN14916_c0_g2_i1:61-1239(+)